MKYCRFEYDGRSRFGLIERLAGHDHVTQILAATPDKGEEFSSESITSIPLKEATLLAPVQPSKIVCIGRNYREHAAELGHDVPTEPLIFLKPPSAILDAGQKIIRPAISSRVDHEAELGVVIGKRCRSLKADEDVRPYILGYTCVNDVTARDLQEKDPWAGVGVEARVNGAVRQAGNTRDFIFALDIVIRHISQVMTLLPGDLIATGTPKGVGPLQAGDVVEVTVEGVGTLRNPVAD